MAAHLLIVDALNLIRRIHAVQGSPCVETCQHALDQLIIHSQPTHAVAVFDDDARSSGWRHQRLPDYKAGRPPMPDDLHNEMPALRAAFEQRGVRCWASDGNEADDLAATLALKVTEAGHQATIVSTDKGYCQLLSPGLRIRDYFQKRWLDAPFIEKEFGVLPRSCRITGVWQESAVRKSLALPVSALKARPSCWFSFKIWREFTPIWTRCRKSGAKSLRRIKKWHFFAAILHVCKPIYISTETYSSYGWRGSFVAGWRRERLILPTGLHEM